MGKLITLLLLLGGVYLAWKWHRRTERLRMSEARAAQHQVATETMVKCSACGAYVSPSAHDACPGGKDPKRSGL